MIDDIIDVAPELAGLPPPLILTVPEASQLIYRLRQDRADTVVQLIATRNGEGVSTLARDLCLVAAANLGLSTLLMASELEPRRSAGWPRGVYGLPPGLQALTQTPGALEMYRVGSSSMVIGAPAIGPILQTAGWAALFSELRSQYELVVIDSPSLQRAYTGIMLAAEVDASLVVVAAESTRASAARILRDRLAEAGGRTAGVILNRRRYHVPQAAYERM